MGGMTAFSLLDLAPVPEGATVGDALRNTLVPLLTTIGIILGGLLSGTFVIETLFNIPGLGRLAIQSIFARDYPVTMAIVLLFTFFYAGLNLVVDLLYGVIDPRIRLTADRGGRA